MLVIDELMLRTDLGQAKGKRLRLERRVVAKRPEVMFVHDGRIRSYCIVGLRKTRHAAVKILRAVGQEVCDESVDEVMKLLDLMGSIC